MQTHTIKHFHLFCGLGGGAKGFNRARPRVGNLQGEFRCLGGVDVDAAAIRDFERAAGAPGTVLDLFDREQYASFHGELPPVGWREAGPDAIWQAAGREFPDVVFLSAPCKGFSGLLPEQKSRTDKYQALNGLTLRGVWLMLEAFRDRLPSFVLFENVPRIATRGRKLLDRIASMLRAYGYVMHEGAHDCGVIAGLGQSRKRFLMVARYAERVPTLLYQPAQRSLRSVGDVLGRLPVPGGAAGGVLHRVPALQWQTWVRLAFVEAGSDWRSLQALAVENGHLRDYLIVPAMFRGGLGVQAWGETSGTIGGESLPMNGRFAVADPRFEQSAAWNDGQAYGVRAWGETSGAIPGQTAPGQGAFAVADPRHGGPDKHSNEYAVVRWDRTGRAVTGAHGTGACVADPRAVSGFGGKGKYQVTAWERAGSTVIAASTTGHGAFAVADPRLGMDAQREAYRTGGHYGVLGWGDTSGAVSAACCHDNGRWSVADPRMPTAREQLVAVIRALDDTWHRPFTTLEVATLQDLVNPDDPEEVEAFDLDGTSDSAKRERIGNAVPPGAAEAIATVIGHAILLSASGETFILSSAPVWVRPLAVALTIPAPVAAQ